jgi:hypothetical protein
MNIYIIGSVIIATIILIALIASLLFVATVKNEVPIDDGIQLMLYSNGGKSNPYLYKKSDIENIIKDTNEYYGLYWRIANKNDILEYAKKNITCPFHGFISDYDKPIRIINDVFPQGIKQEDSELSAIYIMGKSISRDDDIFSSMVFI